MQKNAAANPLLQEEDRSTPSLKIPFNLFCRLLLICALPSTLKAQMPGNDQAETSKILLAVQQNLGNVDLNRWKISHVQGAQAVSDLRSIDEDLLKEIPALLVERTLSPNSINVQFLLYRNFCALYDVLLRMSLLAEQKAPRSQREMLDEARDAVSKQRMNIGNALAEETRTQEMRIAQLEGQVRLATPVQVVPVCASTSMPTKKRKQKRRSKVRPR